MNDMKKIDYIEKIKALDNKLMPIGITPLPKKRSRDPVLNYLKDMYNNPSSHLVPNLAWISILLNAFYTQERIVLALTKDRMIKLCKNLIPPFNDKSWTDFVRVCIKSGSFECSKGTYSGQPWIFVLTQEVILEGFKNRNPDIDLEKMRSEQLAEVKAFVGKAKEIKKPSQSRNRL